VALLPSHLPVYPRPRSHHEPIRFFQLLACRQQAAPAWIYPTIPPKPTTPAKAVPTTPRTSPPKETVASPPQDDKTSIVTETSIDPLDPLKNKKLLRFFFSRSIPQQHEAIENNPCYLSSLIDWKNTLEDTEDLDNDYQELLVSLPHILNLIKYAQQYYQGLSQQISQLKATNLQLKEEANRLSKQGELPHKNTNLSKLNEDNLKLVQQYNELHEEYQKFKPLFDQYPGLTIEELIQKHNELLQNYKAIQNANEELQTLRRDTQNTIAHLPNVKTLDEARSAIKGLIQNEKRSDALAGELQAELINWENVGLALLHSQEGKPPTPFEAEKQADHLVQALRLAKEKLDQFRQNNPMAPGPTGSGMMPNPLSPEQCTFIWNQIPAALKHLPEGSSAPTTSEGLVQALNHSVSCNHPIEAANALELSLDTPWDVSLDQMINLTTHECPEPEETILSSSSRLFRASDVPEFTDNKDYDGFRGSLLSFFQSEDPPRKSEYGRALLRVLGTFKDPIARSAAKNWNVQPLLKNTWEATYQSFLTALDQKFESKTVLQDTKIEWLKCRPKNDEKPAEFFNRFEAITENLKGVQIRKGAPVLSDSIITERLLLVLPRYLVDDARKDSAKTGQMIELQTPRELRDLFEVTWTYLPKPAAHGHNTSNKYDTSNPARANARQTGAQDPSKTAKEPKTYPCGFYGNYDTSPPVPMNLRGSIFPDPRDPSKANENLARKKLCEGKCINCRRNREQHQTNGTNFRPITLNANARQTIATPPQQLQIEAAPSRPESPA
jgi:hypothetical protein